MNTNKNHRRIRAKLFAIFALLFLFSNLKAQSGDPVCGIYIDGVKANELNCYSFGTMVLVLPYDNSYKEFDKVRVSILSSCAGTAWDGDTYLDLTSTSFADYVKGKYLVYEVFGKGIQIAKGKFTHDGPVTRSKLLHVDKFDTPKSPQTLYIEMLALTKSGDKEYYDTGCNCYKREPTYSSTALYRLNLPLKNRIKVKGNPANKPEEIDMSQPCIVDGIKFDFNTLGGTSTSGSNTNNNLSDNKVVKTTDTKTNEATNNTTTSSASSPLNANSLKPLDKNKAGYYSQKNGDKVLAEGYRKDSKNIGERREYDAQGRLNRISTFDENGQKNGLGAEYDPATGNILATGNYKNASKDGEWKRYKNGKVVGTDTYINGTKQ
jgi:hypothetical protein